MKPRNAALLTVAALLVALLALLTLGDALALLIIVIIVGVVVLRGYGRMLATIHPLRQAERVSAPPHTNASADDLDARLSQALSEV